MDSTTPEAWAQELVANATPNLVECLVASRTRELPSEVTCKFHIGEGGQVRMKVESSYQVKLN